MSKWECQICGYVYDEEAGEGAVKPGTKFADLPDEWICPICGAGKDQFKEKK